MEKLVKSFNSGTIPKKGCISIYGKYFGKPGDTISTIDNISILGDTLIIDLGFKKIEIQSPKGISSNSSSIFIQSSRNVLCDGKSYDIESNEKAFALYTW